MYEMRESEVLAQIQHNGGDTNLIVFTTNYLVALFFACDGPANPAGSSCCLRLGKATM